jgi:hypothetical protein
MISQSTLDAIDRRIHRLEQEARTGRPVNVTQTRGVTYSPFAFFPDFQDSPGVESAIAEPSFPLYVPDKVGGTFCVPPVFIVAPIVPTDVADWYSHAIEFGIKPESNDQCICAVDATTTGATIDLYIVFVKVGGSLPSFKKLLCTMARITDVQGSENYYWKGGLPDETAMTNENSPTISTGYESHASVSNDPGARSVTFDGDIRGKIAVGQKFKYSGSSTEYTVESISFAAGQTTIVTVEALPTGGTIIFGGTLLINTDKIPWNMMHKDSVFCSRDDRTDSWVFYPFGFGTPGSVSRYIVGTDIQHPLLEYDNLPVYSGNAGQLLERISGLIIPKGHHTVEAAGDGSTNLVFRYRHHTTGDLYEGKLELPSSGAVGSTQQAFSFLVNYWSEYGTPTLYIDGCFGYELDSPTFNHVGFTDMTVLTP